MTREVSRPDYSAFLASLKERILRARTSAARAFNHEVESIWRQVVAKLFKNLSSDQSVIWPQAVAKFDENSCAETDDIEVEFALKTKTNPIGVAEYQLQARLPAEFKGQLPTAKQLADAVCAVLPSRR